MTGAADSQNPAAGAVDASARPASAARAAAGIGRRAWEQFAENPLQAIFGTAVVALLVFNFTTFNARIDDTNARIDRVEARMDARFTALEEDVAEVNEDLAEINLKLTALIAALNRTEEVEAALEGRLIDPAPVPVPSATSPFPP